MKKVILFHLIILLFACNQAGENNAKIDTSEKTELEHKTESELVNEEDVISDIRKKFVEINQNTNSYEVESKELIGESTEGGELLSYYQGEILKKVVASYFGEMEKLIEEYYFSDGKLVFVFTQQYAHDKPIYVEGSKVESIGEDRYYFHNNKLLRWLDTNKEKVVGSNIAQKESEILQNVKELKDELRGSKTGPTHDPAENTDYINMKSLFSLSPLSIFDETTEALSSFEKEDLLKKGESASWEIIDESKTKLVIQSKDPSSKVTFYFLKNKDNLDGVFAAEVINGKTTSLKLWKYSDDEKALQEANLLNKYNANDFVSQADKLPDSYEPVLYYQFIDDKTIEVSLYTWMEEEFENREIINKIFLKWNGGNFEEKVEKI